jgi:hypothetical protein
LTLTQVYAALTYYHGNGDEIEADIAAEKAESERRELLHHCQTQTQSNTQILETHSIS